MSRVILYALILLLTDIKIGSAQNQQSETLKELANVCKNRTDSLRKAERDFLLALPTDFSEFFKLYYHSNSPLVFEFESHMEILEAMPRRDSLVLYVIVSLSVNARYDVINTFWELSRYTFADRRYMQLYCEQLKRYSHNEIKSVFHFFEYDVQPMRQFKLSDLKYVKENYPEIYRAYLEVRQELGIKN
jgi:hypothetical protein